MTPRPLAELVAPDWAEALAPVAPVVSRMGGFLREEVAAGRGYLPAGDRVLRAFTRPLADVRVLVVGQDPYPTPGHPVGLSFAVAPDVHPLPASLRNIYAELHADLGIEPAPHGDLTRWFEQGVLLLNRCLTVQPGKPASHRGRGWEEVTETAIRALAARGGPLVAILWGRDARSLAPLLAPVPVLESAHPSPLSARNGFFGSRPFSRANAALVAQGARPIDWDLEHGAPDQPPRSGVGRVDGDADADEDTEDQHRGLAAHPEATASGGPVLLLGLPVAVSAPRVVGVGSAGGGGRSHAAETTPGPQPVSPYGAAPMPGGDRSAGPRPPCSGPCAARRRAAGTSAGSR